MIIAEEKLIALFEGIPAITVENTTCKPNYDFGSHADLLRWLKAKAKEGGNKYPLIWLETPVTLSGKTRKSAKLKFVLSALSNSELSNRVRLERTIKPVLVPLFKNVIKTLSQSGITSLRSRNNESYSIHYNYGVNEDESMATDIWDAIKFECEVEFYNKACIKKINY